MASNDDSAMSLAERLSALMDHLGLGAAHLATQMPGDIAAFAAQNPARVAGVVLAVPVRIDPVPFTAVADRLLMVTGETGIGAAVVERTLARLPASRRHILAGYEAPGWADVAADRTGEFVEVMAQFLNQAPRTSGVTASAAPRLPATGMHAGESRIIIPCVG